MSGGSFNYLAHRVESGQEFSAYEVENIATALRERGYPDAADATWKIADAMRAQGSLLKVWHALEWVQSGDWTSDDLIHFVTEWRDDAIARTLGR